MHFNQEEHIKKCEPTAQKFVQHMTAKGMNFSHDSDGKNVTFEKNGRKFTMSYHSFYRFSGMTVMYKDKGERDIESVPLPYEGWLNIIIKPILEKYLLR